MSKPTADVKVQFPNSSGVYGLSYSQPVKSSSEDEIGDQYGLLKWFIINSSPEDKENLEILGKYTWMMGRSDRQLKSPPLILQNLYFLHAEYKVLINVDITKIVSIVEDIYRAIDDMNVIV